MFDGAPTWDASLQLRFAGGAAGTRVAHRHRGPLRVQKPLFPEGPEPCQVVLLHPPGGIAGGDRLQIDVRVEAGAQALTTTPGATRWYKANGRSAAQHVVLAVAGALEWLPQESIVFDDARVESTIDIALERGARMIGWDIVALGRHASGERFECGEFRQRIRLSIDGELQWTERTRIVGGDALLDSPVGLAGHHVFGCLWAAGKCWSDDELEALRTAMGAAAVPAPPTCVAPQLIVVRTLAASTGNARASLEAAWSGLRPSLMNRPAHRPRLWAT
jgi:urease accessory protein